MNTTDTVSSQQTEGIATHNDPLVKTAEVINNLGSIENESALLKNTATAVRNVIGKSAEVNTKGEWEKATIIDKETEFLYKVHYPGRTAENDEWVSVTQIRNIDSSVITPTADKPVTTVAKASTNCSFEAPAPAVLNGDKFSEKLAKRKIYEQYVANTNNSKKTGVTFLSVQTESPYVNTVSISSANTIEVKFAFAPAGAMIYPVKAQYKVCEQVLGRTSSKTVNSNYGCFRNKQGAWTCAKVE